VWDAPLVKKSRNAINLKLHLAAEAGKNARSTMFSRDFLRRHPNLKTGSSYSKEREGERKSGASSVLPATKVAEEGPKKGARKEFSMRQTCEKESHFF